MVFTPVWKQGVMPNDYLASTKGFNARTYTVDASIVPTDGDGNKILPAGTVMAKITATDLIGPHEPNTANAAANEIQQFDLGAASAGTFTISFDGETTGAIAYNAVAATVKTALEALSNINPGDITVTGGALPGTAVVITFGGQWAGKDIPAITIDGAATTGETITIATNTAGAPVSEGSDGATDGRQLLANIVGINDTWLTTELLDGNKEVAVMKEGRVYKAKLYIVNVSGAMAQGAPSAAALTQLRTGDMDILAE